MSPSSDLKYTVVTRPAHEPTIGWNVRVRRGSRSKAVMWYELHELDGSLPYVTNFTDLLRLGDGESAVIDNRFARDELGWD